MHCVYASPLGALDLHAWSFLVLAILPVQCIFQTSFVHQQFLMYGCNDEQSSEMCSASKGNRPVRISKILTFNLNFF